MAWNGINRIVLNCALKKMFITLNVFLPVIIIYQNLASFAIPIGIWYIAEQQRERKFVFDKLQNDKEKEKTKDYHTSKVMILFVWAVKMGLKQTLFALFFLQSNF